MTLILWTAMGICLASAVMHLILWGGSRRERASLFFGLVCLTMMGSFYSDGICYQATTVEEYRRGLKLVFAFALPVWPLYAWFCYSYAKARSRIVPIATSLILGTLFIVNLVMPLSAFTTIQSLRFGTAPWGESFAIPVRTESWALYLFILTITATLIWSITLARKLIATRIWQEGAALCAGTLALIAGLSFDAVRDALAINWIYMTEFGGTTMVLIMGGRLALDHRARKKDLEAALSRQRAIFAAANHVAFIVTNHDEGRPVIREFSPGAERIFDCPSHDAVGRPIDDFLPPESAAAFSQHDQALLKDTGAFNLELTLRQRTGALVPALASFRPLHNTDGTPLGTLTVIIDISERKRIEEAIVRSEADLRRAQQLAHVGSWHFDIPKGVLHCSNELLRIHGHPPG